MSSNIRNSNGDGNYAYLPIPTSSSPILDSEAVYLATPQQAFSPMPINESSENSPNFAQYPGYQSMSLVDYRGRSYRFIVLNTVI